jgi:thiol-disulfide isomerase/thioredoxin
MRHYLRFATIIVLGALVGKLSWAESAAEPPLAPEPTGIARWISSDPLTLESQRGKVIVLHFWTFGCINCQHNLPFYNQWRKDFPADRLQIIGVHTPETEGEADEDSVATQVQKLEIKYPVAVDNELATWRAYQNRYWPAIYLIDKSGRVRYRWDGELEYNDAGGDKSMRARIDRLLREQPE